ncbi:MAG: CRISPR-associated primase-polymerase type A1 [Lachnospiraceae bacterium]|nr:CRISPR-associated primase-polymerase type A1 [Lachnospiraceae bacterium]
MGLYTKIIDLQKLRLAWKQVYKNKPKEGIDEVTCDAFEEDKDNQLKLLAAQLQDHSYECQPVRLCPLYKGEKVRYISLYCMRDKVVQNSLANELSGIYEGQFPPCTYAYRSGKSALEAGNDVVRHIKSTENEYVLRTDIHSFFDCIVHSKLFSILRGRIREADVLELIRNIISVPSMERDGTLNRKQVGIYQGASISPVLSNIYLMRLDEKIMQEVSFYIRYSDDLLLFFQSFDQAAAYRDKLKLYLEELGLELNMEKTQLVSVADGFDFLGYHFDQTGMSVPDKAREQLGERLENIWLDSTLTTFEGRMQKASEIVTGWEQYFSTEKSAGGILEFALRIYRKKKPDQADLEQFVRMRVGLENPFRDVAEYLIAFWNENGRRDMALREYESFYGLPEIWEDKRTFDNMENITDSGRESDDDRAASEKTEAGKAALLRQLLKLYEQYFAAESHEIRVELIQIYTDLKKYRNAAFLTENEPKVNGSQIQLRRRNTLSPVAGTSEGMGQYGDTDAVSLNSKERNRYIELFVGREDLYALNVISENNRRICEDVPEPLLPDVVQSHLDGINTVSTYIQRSNATVKYLVLDLDISKAVLLGKTEEVAAEYKKKCFELAVACIKELRHLGISGYLEDSGNRGYHVWVFFDGWIPARYVNLLTDIIAVKMTPVFRDTGIQIEYFPNKTKVRNGKKGQCIKLPWGIHPKSGRRGCFLMETGEPCQPQSSILDDISATSLHLVKRIISANQAQTTENPLGQNIEVDKDLSEFGGLPDTVRVVLENCTLMRYLCQKARKTRYLTHFERLSILYVFGHLGEEGQEFVHKVMSFTLNYSEHVTQKFITRCPEKPISCIKLRDQYKQITAEIGCACSFRRTKNCYPSPVLHALKKAEENTAVTMPLSRTVSVERQDVMKNEINVTAHVQEIAEKLIEIRKQRRNLDKTARKYEQELTTLFDDNHTDSMEIKMGLLVRRKINDKVEWSIEL